MRWTASLHPPHCVARKEVSSWWSLRQATRECDECLGVSWISMYVCMPQLLWCLRPLIQAAGIPTSYTQELGHFPLIYGSTTPRRPISPPQSCRRCPCASSPGNFPNPNPGLARSMTVFASCMMSLPQDRLLNLPETITPYSDHVLREVKASPTPFGPLESYSHPRLPYNNGLCAASCPPPMTTLLDSILDFRRVR